MIQTNLGHKLDGKDTGEKIPLFFSDKEEGVLNQYALNCQRVRLAKILSNFPIIRGQSLNQREGIKIDVSTIDYGEMCEFLHLVRPLFLFREPASFLRVQGLIGKKSKGTSLTDYLKSLRSTYERGEYQPYFQLELAGIPLFSDSTLKVWLNGVEWHQDEEKAKIVRGLEAQLSEETVRGVFVAQMYGRIQASFQLEELVNVILEPENAGQK